MDLACMLMITILLLIELRRNKSGAHKNECNGLTVPAWLLLSKPTRQIFLRLAGMKRDSRAYALFFYNL
jgi:hypothetical protein